MEEQLYNFFLVDIEGKTTEEINDFLKSDNNISEIVDVQPVGNRLLIKRESLLNRQGRIAVLHDRRINMREIKFRAWDAKEKRMLEVNHLFNLDNKQPIEVWTNYYEGGYRFNPDKSELMQYTGLDDINGKPIYENDIVEFEVGLIRTKAEVVYSRSQFTVNMNSVMSRSLDAYLVKVIGNRFENPELLEEQK
ncbi:YopX family protein [Latilactobacillus curvatus]|uniref:YopX family protein n=1 Tax=Latilactobacillus curvatus TaxID=28038 RepID=UPI00223BA3FC|nr:YopX family protein [Latilactobacillus curvatus]MCS8616165.1 hypothetical protein [Latilactobacillus curvatus]